MSDFSATIEILSELVKFIEAIDPNAAQNPIMQKIQNAINEINSVIKL